MSNKLTEEEIGRAIQIVENGSSYTEVGKIFGADGRTILRTHGKWKEFESIKRIMGSGRRKTWNNRVSRQVKRWIYSGECSTAVDMLRKLDIINVKQTLQKIEKEIC